MHTGSSTPPRRPAAGGRAPRRHPQLRCRRRHPRTPVPGRNRRLGLRRGQQPDADAALGRWRLRPAARSCGRISGGQGRRDNRARARYLGGAAGDHQHPDHRCLQWRHGGDGRRREPRPARRQHYGLLLHVGLPRGEAARALEQRVFQEQAHRRALQPARARDQG